MEAWKGRQPQSLDDGDSSVDSDAWDEGPWSDADCCDTLALLQVHADRMTF